MVTEEFDSLFENLIKEMISNGYSEEYIEYRFIEQVDHISNLLDKWKKKKNDDITLYKNKHIDILQLTDSYVTVDSLTNILEIANRELEEVRRRINKGTLNGEYENDGFDKVLSDDLLVLVKDKKTKIDRLLYVDNIDEKFTSYYDNRNFRLINEDGFDTEIKDLEISKYRIIYSL